MSTPTQPWLPPLNTQHPYTVIVAAYELKKHHPIDTSAFSRLNYSHTDPAIMFHVHTFVKFSPYDNNPKKIDFKGLSIHKRYGNMLYSDLTSSSPNSKETITNLLGPLLSIPFGFDRVFFTESYVYDDRFHRKDTPTRNLEDMISRISRFVSCVKEKPNNREEDVLFLGLRIEKRVMIPDEEYEEWINWYDEKKRSDSDFEKNYMTAIKRPRRYQEIVYDTTLTFRATSRTQIEGLLQGFLNDEKGRSCSICQDEILVGSEGTRLQCSHVFHVECITRWLSQSHVCPICRFSFPTV